ncbi:MAG TPA: transporter [Opitutaceae bacterium]|nr:transporter [Opitutaceae bacterium]
MIFSPRIRTALLCLAVASPGLRAQVTESPQTVAPGRILVEMDGLRFSTRRADSEGHRFDALAVASTIVTAGLTATVDLQVGFDLFLRERFEVRGQHESHSGLGDLAFRTKWTFWPADKGGGASAAVIPYVKIPSGSSAVGSDAIEGGFIVPWSFNPGAGLTAGAMLQWDVVRNDAASGYDSRWLLSSYVERRIIEAFGVYAEGMLEAASTGRSHWAGTVGAGALWNLSKHLQLDYQLMRGLNNRATDWTHVLRVNWEW